MSETSWKSLRNAAMTVLEGDFPVVVVAAEATKSQNGKKMLKCKLKVESGPYAGRTIPHNFTFSPESPNAVWFWFNDLAILGADDAFFDTDPSDTQIAMQIVNRRATVTLEKKTYNGRDSEQVKRWHAPVGASFVTVGVPSDLPTATTLPAASAVTVAAPSGPADGEPVDPF